MVCPAIGVIIPVRDGAATLAAAIESVRSQDPQPADIVVVDGGSVDRSASIARSFSGVRVIAQVGRGLASARNQGLKEVKGDILGFCDSDDRWMPGSMAARLIAFEKDRDCGAVIGHVVWTAIEGMAATSRQSARIGQVREGYTPGALLARRSVFEAVGEFGTGLSIGCDSDWFVRLSQSDVNLKIITDVVLAKGAREASLSTDLRSYRSELLQVARDYIRRRKQPDGPA